MGSLFNRGGRLYLSVKGKTVFLGIRVSAKTTAPELKSSLNRAAGRLASTLSPAQLGEFGSLLNKPASELLSMAQKSAGRSRPRTGGRRTSPGVLPKRIEKPKVLTSKITERLVRLALMGNKKAIESLAKNRESLEKYLSNSKNYRETESLLFSKMQNIPKFSSNEGYIVSYVAAMLPDIFPNAEAPFVKPKDTSKWAGAIRLSMRMYLSDFVPGANAEFKEKLTQIYGASLPSLTTKQKEDETFIKGQIGPDSKLLGGIIDANLFLSATTYILVDRFKQNDAYKSILKKMDLLVPSEAKTEIETKTLPLKTPVVAVVGDSITGEKIGQKIGYVAMLDKALKDVSKNSIVDGYGIKGQSSTGILARFEDNITKRKYNTVLIQGGVNDAYNYPKSKDKTAEIVKTVIATILFTFLSVYPFST